MIARRFSVLALALACIAPLPASAQLKPKPRKPPPTHVPLPKKPAPKVRTTPATSTGKPSSLKSRTGIAMATALLRAGESSERVRGLERLGEVGTPPALELLGKSLEPGGAAKTWEERLAAVRALAQHTSTEAARQALARAMASSATGRADDAGETLVRDTAALALARSRKQDSLEMLGKALRQEGPVASSASRALIAHPPRDLRAILESRGAPTRALVDLLEGLGDQRAFASLRAWVKYGSPELKARSALALTRLGDFETVELARRWLASKNKKDAALRSAATQILVLARANDAPRAVARLLDDSETRDLGLDLARTLRSPELLPALEKRLGTADASSAPALLGVIGRIGTNAAADVLFRELTQPERGFAAAYALGVCTAPEAKARIERALDSDKTRRSALRAAVLREFVLGDSVSGLEAALERGIVAQDPADRAAAAWGIATRDEAKARTLLGRSDLVVVRAAARSALSGPRAERAAERLANETDSLTRVALAVSLAHEASAGRVPTRVLIELLEEGGAASPVAAKALASRDDEHTRPQIERYAKSGDPLIRAHVALGLADSRDPSSVGILGEMYRAEQNSDVRHAVVVALSRRADLSREKILALAADLDGDERVRSAARLARKGARLGALPAGRGTLWLALVDDSSAGGPPAQARIGTPSGVALPVVGDPDGTVTLARLPEGPLSLRLASESAEDNARSSGR